MNPGEKLLCVLLDRRTEKARLCDERKYVEASYYKYDILDGSDAIGFELQGVLSNSISLSCQNESIALFGEDISKQALSVQHNDDVLTKEVLSGSIEEGANNATVYTSENGIGILSEDSTFSPCNGTYDCPGNIFTDMPVKGNWAHDPIDWAIVNKITSGTSATTFSPNAGCTRAQVVTFLWRAAGSPEPVTSNNPFKDVKNGSYYFKAVLWAVENKITSGTAADKFSPSAICTRAQIVTFLWHFEKEPTPTTTNNPFTDVKSGSYYEKAVLWAAENGITAGTGANIFNPKAVCTRAQVLTFLYKDIMK